MTMNQDVFDAENRHQTFLRRYSAGLRKDINSLLNATEEDVARQIRDTLRNNNGIKTKADWNRLNKLNASLGKIRGKSWDQVEKLLLTSGNELVNSETSFNNSVVVGNSPVVIATTLPAPAVLATIVASRPFEGRVMKGWASKMQADDINRISNVVKLGMTQGQSSDAIARRVIGTGALKGTDGITELTRSNVNSVVRTAVQHINNEASNEFAISNKGLIKKERYTATLDSVTTRICSSLDGKVFRVGEGSFPPLHFSCRSVRIPVFDSDLIGARPAVPTTRKIILGDFAKQEGLGKVTSIDQLPRSKRAAFKVFERKELRKRIGTVPPNTSYQKWLETQSKAFQDETLGITKAKLFRDGNLKLTKYVDRNGNELSLTELARREPDAFRKAGLTSFLKPGTPAGVKPPPAAKPSSVKPRKAAKPTKPVKKQFFDPNTKQAKWHNAALTNAPLFLQAAVTKFDSRLTSLKSPSKNNGAFFDPNDNSITMPSNLTIKDAKSRGVWAHEYGHFLDFQMRPGSQISLDKDFVSTMLSDNKKILLASGKSKVRDNAAFLAEQLEFKLLDDISEALSKSKTSVKRNITGLAGELGLNYKDVKDFLRSEVGAELGERSGDRRALMLLHAIKSKNVNLIPDALSSQSFNTLSEINKKGNVGLFSDLIGSATKNELLGASKLGFGGHSDKYLSFKGHPETEVFANLTSLLGGGNKVWEKVVTGFYPELTKVYKGKF